MTFDEIRAANPDLGLALYAIEPGQPVTLEVYTPDGQTFSWRAADAAAALALAFPPEPAADVTGLVPSVPDPLEELLAGVTKDNRHDEIAVSQPTTPDIFG